MKEISINDVRAAIADRMADGGVFLSSGRGDDANVMVIGWGGFVRFFSRQLFLAPVRLSRFTHHLIAESGAFTVSVPLAGLREELAYAGSQSGRQVKKFSGHGLTALPAQAVDSVIVAECGLHLECRVLARVEMALEGIERTLLDRWYAQPDPHTQFLGEVLRCYRLD